MPGVDQLTAAKRALVKVLRELVLLYRLKVPLNRDLWIGVRCRIAGDAEASRSTTTTMRQDPCKLKYTAAFRKFDDLEGLHHEPCTCGDSQPPQCARTLAG